MISNAHLIYFSPTQTTQKIVEQIAAGLSADKIEHHNLTLSPAGLDLHLTDGLAVIGIPVYAGRVPEVCLKRLEKLSADRVPAVIVALYGNREFEDALVELRDIAVSKGFIVIAAAAFIGEHSYSTVDQPIAANRPDQADLQKAREFGEAIAQKMQDAKTSGSLDVPGDLPYKERVPLGGISPETNQATCTLCGTCASVCPTAVIKVNGEVLTEASRCVMCCACVKHCPVQARTLNHPMVEARRKMLIENCSLRKEPVTFL